MLPLGHIGIRSGFHGLPDRQSRFTKDEQLTLITLWCIFRSPLMFGGDLRDNDAWTLSLLTNPEVLEILKHSHSNRQLYRRDECVAWTAVASDGGLYLAHFNLRAEPALIETTFEELQLSGRYHVRNLWELRDMGDADRQISTSVPAHGAALLRLSSAGS